MKCLAFCQKKHPSLLFSFKISVYCTLNLCFTTTTTAVVCVPKREINDRTNKPCGFSYKYQRSFVGYWYLVYSHRQKKRFFDGYMQENWSKLV